MPVPISFFAIETDTPSVPDDKGGQKKKKPVNKRVSAHSLLQGSGTQHSITSEHWIACCFIPFLLD